VNIKSCVDRVQTIRGYLANPQLRQGERETLRSLLHEAEGELENTIMYQDYIRQEAQEMRAEMRRGEE